MKTKILLLVVLLSLNAFPQIMEGPYFNELRGMEDKYGNTHLFYRLYDFQDSINYKIKTNNNIWHYNVVDSIDTLFQNDFANNEPTYTYVNRVKDFIFWKNDPAKFLLGGSGGIIHPGGFIQRFDMSTPKTLSINGFINKVFISCNNDSLLFASGSSNYISKDGGWNWDTLRSLKGGNVLIGIHPQNDSTMFFINNNYLYKSTDMGLNSAVVDSSIKATRNELFFDCDNKHIYYVCIDRSNWQSTLFVSDNSGEPKSWRKCFDSKYQLLFSIDYSKPGHIYLTDGFDIHFSNNFGATFTKIKTFDKKIIGIYKKPDSNILYLAQRYNLIEMVNDSVTILKKLPIPSHLLSLYPLAIGNKWVYEAYFEDHTMTKTPCVGVREVSGDTLMDNGKKYFILRERRSITYPNYSQSFERVDSVLGKIYRYDSYYLPEKEIVAEDLTTEDGETPLVNNYMTPLFSPGSSCKSFTSDLLGSRRYGLSFSVFVDGIGGVDYSLASGLGISEFVKVWEIGYFYYSKLRGAIINGQLLGDTTLTDVKTAPDNLPVNFNLFQNYPNPFNPTTVIKYSLPKEARISLNIYNILGQKVKELVNQIKAPGVYEVNFDGSQLSSGIYFYRLQAGGNIATKKLIIAK